MMTELCQEIRNWFDRDLPKLHGKVSIDAEGHLDNATIQALNLKEGQYFRIIGSIFNDGVHVFTSSISSLKSEDFDGTIWAMAVPPQVVALAAEIGAWKAKYGGVDSVNMSPYNSESFGGYSYSKSGGGSTDGATSAAGTWQGAFAKSLNMWRKI